jgi:lipopolysaccharide/colanic/teichoic acid biosynthesis glycosyltransferase
MYVRIFKRIIDLTVALAGFIVLLPLFMLICILLALANRGSIFFLQKRPGKGEQIFSIIKFKTMNDLKDGEGNLLPDAERLSSIGKFIRKTSLDEVPQLLNVIKGDMSLVGPRPLLVQYIPLYNEQQRKRHQVKPGITGWAQVNGRNSIGWKEKFEYDTWYVEHASFLLDAKILWKTIEKVLKSEGINSSSSVPMEKFTGN